MPRLDWVPRLAVVLGACLLLLGTPGPAQAAACACRDRSDMELRIKEAKAAIEAYQREQQAMAAQEAREEKPLMWTEERHVKLKGRVQDAINEVGSGRPRPTGETNSACEIEIKGNPTPCERDSLTRHERVHQRSCAEKKGWVVTDILKGQLDWKENMRLADFADEERQGYDTEVTFLEGELAKCRAQLAGSMSPPFQRNRADDARRRIDKFLGATAPAGQ